MHTQKSLVVSALALAVAASAIPTRAADTKVYTNADLGVSRTSSAPLYTNNDLARYGKPEPARTPARAPVPDASADWAFVQAALDREHERRMEERLLELELERLRHAGDGESDADGYLVYPFAFRHSFFEDGRGSDRRRHHAFDPRKSRRNPFLDDEPPLRRFISRRETLHGRPPASEVGHGRYEFLKGSDAFPKRGDAVKGDHGKRGRDKGGKRGHDGRGGDGHSGGGGHR